MEHENAIQVQPVADALAPEGVGVDDPGLLVRLRGGDEAAFEQLLRAYGPSMLRVARLYVRTQAIAEEVVQDTWLRVLQSLDRFEGRSTLRTWIFVILGNVARTRAEREGRSEPVASLDDNDADERAVPANRFFSSSHPRWAGMWSTLVDSWEGAPHERILGAEGQAQLRTVVEGLPPNYATVFTLRDIEGWPAAEVCALLGLTPENQRVLLHRARTRIRAALEAYFEVKPT